jgi:hypothetical protein
LESINKANGQMLVKKAGESLVEKRAADMIIAALLLSIFIL